MKTRQSTIDNLYETKRFGEDLLLEVLMFYERRVTSLDVFLELVFAVGCVLLYFLISATTTIAKRPAAMC